MQVGGGWGRSRSCLTGFNDWMTRVGAGRWRVGRCRQEPSCAESRRGAQGAELLSFLEYSMNYVHDEYE